MLIFTLEGFTPASLSCYGSSWNRTPAIDRLAGQGETFNRVITPVVDPLVQWDRWAAVLARNAEATSLVVITDDERLLDRESAATFEEMVLIEDDEPLTKSEALPDESIPIEQTMLGRLTAVAADRISRGESVWIHSRFLTRHWDAPRELGDAEELDDEFDDQPEEEFDGGFSSEAQEERVPWMVTTPQPPDVVWHADDDPDWITTWMRTYGCQIRLVDAMVDILTSLESSTIILGGTSGFALGQNGGIGHRTGSWRSCHLHVPLICFRGTGVRSRDVLSADALANFVCQRIDSPNKMMLSPDAFSVTNSTDENDADAGSVITRDGEVPVAITTNEWFFVMEADSDAPPQDADDEGRLFLKPDDINDFNNVIRLRRDDADRLRDQLLSNQTSER